MLSHPVRWPIVVGLWTVLSACFAPDPIGEACDVGVGDLVITEVMANPIGRYDTDHEWFEVFNAAGSSRVLDRLVLRRLKLSGPRDETVVSKTHHVRAAGRIAAGAYFVLGDGSPDDGPVDYSYDDDDHPLGVGESFGALTNSGGGLELACGSTTVDRVLWGRDVGNDASVEGWSVGLDGSVWPDAERNDDGDWWCSGGPAYDAEGNRGTPGAPNEVCP